VLVGDRGDPVPCPLGVRGHRVRQLGIAVEIIGNTAHSARQLLGGCTARPADPARHNELDVVAQCESQTTTVS